MKKFGQKQQIVTMAVIADVAYVQVAFLGSTP